MPLFKVGHFERIGMKSQGVAKKLPGALKATGTSSLKFPKMLTADAVGEASFTIQPPKLDLAVSPKNWSLRLNSLTLKEDFESFISGKNEVYFTAFAWDYSGQAPSIYPPTGVNPSQFIIPMKPGQQERFIGNGVELFPARKVTGSLNCVIIVYESDTDVQKLGEQLIAVKDAVTQSNLATLIKAISTNPALATGVAIGSLVAELIGVIGQIMKLNGNDYVELFQGSYGTDLEQSTRTESYDNLAASIDLSLTLS